MDIPMRTDATCRNKPAYCCHRDLEANGGHIVLDEPGMLHIGEDARDTHKMTALHYSAWHQKQFKKLSNGDENACHVSLEVHLRVGSQVRSASGKPLDITSLSSYTGERWRSLCSHGAPIFLCVQGTEIV